LYIALKKDGAAFPSMIYTNPIYCDGKYSGLRGIVVDVTEQKKAEDALKESEGRFRMLFDSANDAIVIMQKNICVDCNVKAMEIFGCRKEELVGHTPRGLYPEYQPDGSVSDKKAFKLFHMTLEEGVQFFEWRFTRKNGSVFDSEVSLNRLEIGGEPVVQVIIRDITMRKHTEEALRHSEEKYRILVEHANDAVFVIQDGKMQFVNPKTEELIGLPFSELSLRPFIEFIHPEDRTVVSERYFKHLKGESLSDSGPIRYLDRRGRTRWVELNSVDLLWEDRPAFLFLVKMLPTG
jgi:PAS domain S-box